MPLPDHKTKIICTIGPASESLEVLEKMIRAGMDVARLNFSHGDYERHRRVIGNVRAAARAAGRRVAILGDLPGPKIRIGKLDREPVELHAGRPFTLTTQETTGDGAGASTSFSRLPDVVKRGDTLFLNDGIVQLEVQEVSGTDVRCRVAVGGEIRSRVGLNLPGIDLGISAFTDEDRRWLRFAAGEGLDAVSQSFVERASDIAAVREAAHAMAYHPLVIAKIERARALDGIDDLLEAADGLMIARGDLGVEIPIERIALVQKTVMRKANLAGKPVITATQMLESMTAGRRPTRAEATDAANAILDGTDCVMLSGESAIGRYPVEATAMLARIAAVTEPALPGIAPDLLRTQRREDRVRLTDLISTSVRTTVDRVTPAAVFVPTRSGATARIIARFRLPVWIVAVSAVEATCQRLQFTWGVHAVFEPEHPEDWKGYIGRWLADNGVAGELAVLTEGPSSKHPEANHRMEIVDLRNEKGV
ncbi:MAG TPA: pyruvate kinase [Syntrophales bacterium]|nr:pyruvate kinase [Syntrophales bacterium]